MRSRWFSTKKRSGGGVLLFRGNRQVASVSRYDDGYTVFFADGRVSDPFANFPEADFYAWINYDKAGAALAGEVRS